jgi:SAM-dependent methyltransferase
MSDPLAQLKEGARHTWSLGDYVKIAQRIEPAARELVDACAIWAGQEVLDVAAGNGNVAVLAAREGAAAVASDLTPAMVELGRMRTESEGLEVEWLVADVEELPFEDQRFDCVTSAFGAMFAPRPEVASAEMFRVVRAGGTVGMVNWSPDGFMGRLFEVVTSYAPPAPVEAPRPLDWGAEAVVRERFEGLAGSIDTDRREVHLAFESPDAAWSFFGGTAGPALALLESLDDEQTERLRSEMLDLVGEWNRTSDGSVEIAAEFLLAVARRPG